MLYIVFTKITIDICYSTNTSIFLHSPMKMVCLYKVVCRALEVTVQLQL